MNTPPRAPRRPGGAIRSARFALAVAIMAVLGVVGAVEAYRFYGYSGSQWFLGYGKVPIAEDALRWSPDVWGPGETLVFEIAPGPGWELVWGSEEAAVPYVERALNAWSGIPTADISWSVVVGETQEARGDGRNTVSVIMGYDNAYGSGRFERSGEGANSPYQIVECDLGFGLTIPEDLEPVDIEEYLEGYREGSVWPMVHEFGHCLGLNHADVLSINPGRRSYQADGTRLSNAAMSYGWRLEYGISADDRVGASLLRPVASSAAESGSVPGVVLVDGEPVPYAHVWALPFGPAPLRGLIGVFTDGDGAFLLEGLEPGDYTLWAQPIAEHDATPDLMAEGAVRDLTDTIVGRLIQVRPGATTANVQIPMRRGRAPRRPPEEVPPEWKRSSLTSMRRADAEVCSGLRVEAERPYPAGGPLSLARPEFSEGRDQWFATTVTAAWSPRADGTVLDWAGPYRDWWWSGSDDEAAVLVPAWVEGGERRQAGARGPFLDVWILDYRIEQRGSVARHTIEFAWPGAAEAILSFRSADGASACDGEPRIVCNAAGCELRR